MPVCDVYALVRSSRPAACEDFRLLLKPSMFSAEPPDQYLFQPLDRRVEPLRWRPLGCRAWGLTDDVPPDDEDGGARILCVVACRGCNAVAAPTWLGRNGRTTLLGGNLTSLPAVPAVPGRDVIGR